MRTFWTLALALAVPAGCVAAEPAEAILPAGTTIQLILLRQKSVQEDLKVTPEVAQKVAEFTTKESEEYQKALKLNETERKAKIEELERANRKFLEDNLSAAQRKRLGQITLQVTGLQQLTRPEVARALNLTEEQQKKFKEMHQEARKEFAGLINSKDREGRNEKLAKLREAYDKKIDDLLTDEQKAKAKEYIGEPFKGKLVFEGPE